MNKIDNETLIKIIASITAVFAAIIAIYGNVKIKLLESSIAKSKERENQRLNFYLPFLRFSYEFDRRIGLILNKLDTDWLCADNLHKIQNKRGFAANANEKGYFIISSIYIFSCFFGWSEAIKKSGGLAKAIPKSSGLRSNLKKALFIILKPLGIKQKLAVFMFDPDISIISKMFQYEELFDHYKTNNAIFNPKDSSKLHKQFQYSIGELMLEKDDQTGLRCKSFREFFDCYTKDKKFRYWFPLLENMFIDLSNFKSATNIEIQVKERNDIRPLRLLAIRYWCRVLMKNMAIELDISTPPPDDVLKDLSAPLKKIIKSVQLEKLDSYLFGVSIAKT